MSPAEIWSAVIVFTVVAFVVAMVFGDVAAMSGKDTLQEQAEALRKQAEKQDRENP